MLQLGPCLDNALTYLRPSASVAMLSQVSTGFRTAVMRPEAHYDTTYLWTAAQDQNVVPWIASYSAAFALCARVDFAEDAARVVVARMMIRYKLLAWEPGAPIITLFRAIAWPCPDWCRTSSSGGSDPSESPASAAASASPTWSPPSIPPPTFPISIESHYTILVITDASLVTFDDYSDEYGHTIDGPKKLDLMNPGLQSLRFEVRGNATIREVLCAIELALAIPAGNARLWECKARENRTIRPERCITSEHVDQRLASMWTSEDLLHQSRILGSILLYVETVGQLETVIVPNPGVDVETGAVASFVSTVRLSACRATAEWHTATAHTLRDAQGPPATEPPALPWSAQSSVLIFFKFLDLEDGVYGRLNLVGRAIVHERTLIAQLFPLMRRMAALDEHASLVVKEEITPTFIADLATDRSLAENELINGDILCFRRVDAEAELPSICPISLFFLAQPEVVSPHVHVA